MNQLGAKSAGIEQMLGRTFRGIHFADEVRLGVIVNPNARYLKRSDGIERITNILGPQRVVRTRSVEQIPRALEYLLCEQRVTVLGICGGDGTIHHTLNALLPFCGEPQREGCEGLSLPPVLLLRGGTLNMVARATLVEGQVTSLLNQFLRRFSRSMVGDLPLCGVNLVRVSDAAQNDRYGFIFGSEITARALELYEERFGAGYKGLAKFLKACVKAYILKDEMWDMFEPFLTGAAGELVIDGQRIPYQAVVASSVDIKLLAGVITGLEVDRSTPGNLGVRILEPQTPARLLRNLPNLMFGRSGKGIADLEQVRSLRIDPATAYSFDGEVFQVPANRAYLDVSCPSWTLPVVSPFP